MILGYRTARRIRKYRGPVLYLLAFLFILDALLITSSRPPTIRTPVPAGGSSASASSSGGNTSVFIVSVHRNTEEVLRAAWNDAILGLADHLGSHNVHFAALESGSQDGTKEALMELKEQLDARGVSNTISLGMTVWEQLEELDARPDPQGERVPGWIWDDQEDRFALRRIPYLARVRNQAMEPLQMLEKMGRKFDKIFWVNDVVFDVSSHPLAPSRCCETQPSPKCARPGGKRPSLTGLPRPSQTSDFLTLLNTNDGSYAAACSMDFKVYPYYYDTFALRDDRGDKAVSHHWPWFLSPASRAAAQRNRPVRVASCWNGMVLFDSAPFYAAPPLQFRGIDDSLADLHLEGSECCLVHADNEALAAEKGVWLNPNVRVGYSAPVYRRVRNASGGGLFPGGRATAVRAAWANRWARWTGAVQLSLERATVRQRLRAWRAATPEGELSRTEIGEFCLINEMQIMWENGWRHL